jgi:hypothetical protein
LPFAPLAPCGSFNRRSSASSVPRSGRLAALRPSTLSASKARRASATIDAASPLCALATPAVPDDRGHDPQ